MRSSSAAKPSATDKFLSEGISCPLALAINRLTQQVILITLKKRV